MLARTHERLDGAAERARHLCVIAQALEGRGRLRVEGGGRLVFAARPTDAGPRARGPCLRVLVAQPSGDGGGGLCEALGAVEIDMNQPRDLVPQPELPVQPMREVHDEAAAKRRRLPQHGRLRARAREPSGLDVDNETGGGGSVTVYHVQIFC